VWFRDFRGSVCGIRVQFVPTEHGSEKWANFPRERTRFLDLLRRTRAQGVVIVSGNRHLAELSVLSPADGAPFPLCEMTTIGLNQPAEKEAETRAKHPPKGTPNRFRIHERPHTGSNFGLIRVGRDGTNPSLRLEIRGLRGDAVLSREMSFPEIQAK
jgi:alkaline phosphatase D